MRSRNFSRMKRKYSHKEQLPCWLTYTSEETHRDHSTTICIARRCIRERLKERDRDIALRSKIKSSGSAISRSIRFFWSRKEEYVGILCARSFHEHAGGCSAENASLDPRLENAEMMRTGYAIEYDAIVPTQLVAIAWKRKLSKICSRLGKSMELPVMKKQPAKELWPESMQRGKCREKSRSSSNVRKAILAC